MCDGGYFDIYSQKCVQKTGIEFEDNLWDLKFIPHCEVTD